MKKLFIAFLIVVSIALSASAALATSGACSSHGGVNCGIGAINGQAVCNDGWLSSVPYNSMVECLDYSSSCSQYFDGAKFVYQTSLLKTDLTNRLAAIDEMKSNLGSLDLQEEQAVLQLEQDASGRGITTSGLQPQIDAIQNEYDSKTLALNETLQAAIDEYNAEAKEYNGICRLYTDDDRSTVCAQNFGAGYTFTAGTCFSPPSISKTISSPPISTAATNQEVASSTQLNHSQPEQPDTIRGTAHQTKVMSEPSATTSKSTVSDEITPVATTTTQATSSIQENMRPTTPRWWQHMFDWFFNWLK